MSGQQRNHGSQPTPPLVTLLTDFGLNDEYVGVMKGVILTYAPEARLVDITHLVPPQNVAAASHLLARSYPYFPRGTVHLVVVDPGVGSSRSILALAGDGHYFIGPDNGVFTPVFLRATSLAIHRVTASHLFLARIGSTFHGRDIMAPIAGRLAAGLELEQVGPAIAARECVRISADEVILEGEMLRGEIRYIDRFGNLCTTFGKEDVERFAASREVVIRIGDLRIPFCTSYADSPAGAPLALYDSHDRVEIAINQGNAARALAVTVGTPIFLSLCLYEKPDCG